MDVYIAVLSPAEQTYALQLADRLRETSPELRIRVHAGGGKLKNQLKKADQCGASWAALVGADEAAGDNITLKALNTGEQITLSIAEASARLSATR